LKLDVFLGFCLHRSEIVLVAEEWRATDCEGYAFYLGGDDTGGACEFQLSFFWGDSA
jgi:hypothetical protein